jgi:hypothetical protein
MVRYENSIANDLSISRQAIEARLKIGSQLMKIMYENSMPFLCNALKTQGFQTMCGGTRDSNSRMVLPISRSPKVFHVFQVVLINVR